MSAKVEYMLKFLDSLADYLYTALNDYWLNWLSSSDHAALKVNGSSRLMMEIW